MKISSATAIGALLGLSALVSQHAVAQSGRDRGTVCIYEHAGFKGWEQCYDVGAEVSNLSFRANRVSSIRITGRARITVYDRPGFSGRSIEFTDDVPDLSRIGGWNDQIDSFRVSSRGFAGGPGGRPSPPRGGDGRVCVYEHAQYQGRSQCWQSGDKIPDLVSLGWNDKISSIRTFGRTRLTFYEHTGFQGREMVVDYDIPNLQQIPFDGRSNWNDRISSLTVGDDRGRGGRSHHGRH